jgi:hypothetical protein
VASPGADVGRPVPAQAWALRRCRRAHTWRTSAGSCTTGGPSCCAPVGAYTAVQYPVCSSTPYSALPPNPHNLPTPGVLITAPITIYPSAFQAKGYKTEKPTLFLFTLFLLTLFWFTFLVFPTMPCYSFGALRAPL